MPRLITSWDDGHPADLKLAELLNKHGVAATFYVPSRNAEGRPVLNAGEIMELSRMADIGGHGVNHIPLTGLSPADLAAEIVDNKAYLEDCIGRAVSDFAYVRGKHNVAVTRAVKAAGYSSARTVVNLSTATTPTDPFLTPTTLQFYPHSRPVYVRNFVRNDWTADRATNLMLSCGTSDLHERIARMARAARRSGGVFHLWGHSWELEEHGLWDRLKQAIAMLREIFPAPEGS